MSGIITSPQFFAQFDPMSADMQGTVTALMEVGAFFGAALCFWTGDMYGRRKNSFIGAAIMALGAVLHAASVGIFHDQLSGAGLQWLMWRRLYSSTSVSNS